MLTWKGAGSKKDGRGMRSVDHVLNHQPKKTFQRRIYRLSAQRELCYFAFLIEGQDAVNQQSGRVIQ